MKPIGNNSKPPTSNYMRYVGAGTQMLVTIGGGVFLGIKLDQWTQTKTPWWTVGCSLFFIFASMYLLIKSLPKE